MAEEWAQTVSDEELVQLVQTYARHFVPEVVCELKDYRHRLGLGALDKAGKLHEVIFLKKDVTPDRIEINAKILLTKLYPGQSLVD